MSIKKSKASVLVVTLMVLGIVLVTALSISLVSIQERKASMGSNKSNAAFQTANTGIEKVMDVIISNRSDSSKTLASIGCFGGKIIGADYVVELKKDNGSGDEVIVDCNADKLSDIIAIKSIGTGSGQQRAIEAAVASVNWIDATLQNAWVTYDNTTYNKAQYVKNNDDIVYLRGAVKSGVANTCIFTLPSAYQPKKTVIIGAMNGAALAYVTIDTTGCVKASSGGATLFSLDGILFSID